MFKKKNFKKRVGFTLSLAFSFALTFPLNAIKIGIILPLQHTALEEIISGFKETLEPYLTPNDEITIKNAQGDATLQYQIIQQMEKNSVDYFIPVGTATALMTLSLVKKKPVLAVAAVLTPKDLPNTGQPVGVINDEVEIKKILEFVKQVLPSIKTIGVIYANSEKNFLPIQHLQEFCQKNDLTLHLRKIDTLTELLPAAQSLFPVVEAVFILKDNLIVSGLMVLVTLAKKHKKLLIAMDDTSVKQGAHFAIGIPEKEIGCIAAQHLSYALKGNPSKAYGIHFPSSLWVCCNQQRLAEIENISLEKLEESAKMMNFSFRTF